MKPSAAAPPVRRPEDLSERQKKHLRALAHALTPVVRLGNAGVTAAVIAEAGRALEDHELIKVKGPGGDRAKRDELFRTLAGETGSALVHRIGNVALLYRASAQHARILIPDG